jgi:hypothetical protein
MPILVTRIAHVTPGRARVQALAREHRAGYFRALTAAECDTVTSTSSPALASIFTERIDRELVDVAPDHVAHARLCHAEQLGRLVLRQSAFINHPLDCDHQLRADPQTRSFCAVESEIAEDVHFHQNRLSLAGFAHGHPCCPYHRRASAMSLSALARTTSRRLTARFRSGAGSDSSPIPNPGHVRIPRAADRAPHAALA